MYFIFFYNSDMIITYLYVTYKTSRFFYFGAKQSKIKIKLQ